MQYQAYTRQSITQAPQWSLLPEEVREAVLVVSMVLPFRTNRYVLDELIDWERVPDDPIYRLTFPHRDMLPRAQYDELRDLLFCKHDERAAQRIVNELRTNMNPHPAGQMTHNVPSVNGHQLRGLQHKYRETVLFFPAAGQTCHAYCTFCFRWPQFVGVEEMRFAANTVTELVEYLESHKSVTDVLITGGDPMVMDARVLERYIDPLLSSPELAHIESIRIGTKSLSYWPHRYLDQADSDHVLRLFERIVASGRNLAVMAHYNHPAELRTAAAQRALRRIVSTGATVRMQAPLVRHINDNAAAWVELWRTGVRLGAIPYYMFVERDTGPRQYFEVPLVEAYEIFREAYKSVPGLARTVRGPSMSTDPGKVMIDGIVQIGGEQVFALQFLQARNADWVRKPFYAKFDSSATWFDQLSPAFGERRFFFERDEAPRIHRHAAHEYHSGEEAVLAPA